MNFLVIEDDDETAALVTRALTIAPQTAGMGWPAPRLGFTTSRFVDRMLPGLDGLSLVKSLRAQGSLTAVLFLTNLGGIDDRVEGFEAGGLRQYGDHTAGRSILSGGDHVFADPGHSAGRLDR